MADLSNDYFLFIAFLFGRTVLMETFNKKTAGNIFYPSNSELLT